MIYENILDVAKKKKMSLNRIEKEANLSSGAIGKWKKSSPTVDNIKAVAKVLNVSVNTLIKD